MTEKRKAAIENIQFPPNRPFYKMVLSHLKENGIYGYPDYEEVFTRSELQQLIDEAEEKEKDTK
jgi:hypothetical protein